MLDGVCLLRLAMIIIDRFVFYGILFIILWTPLPWGSHTDWAVYFFCAAVFFLAAIWLIGYLLKSIYREGGIETFALHGSVSQRMAIFCLFMVTTFWLLFQTVPLSYETLTLFSPQAADIYREAQLPDQPPVFGSISVERYRTRLETIETLALGIWFLLLTLTVNEVGRFRWLCYTIVVSGAFQAFYGALMTLSGLENTFFLEKEGYRGFATGTFINRNHLAGYLEMALSVGIGSIVGSDPFFNSRKIWVNVIAKITALLLSDKAPLRLALVMMAIGLVLTRSRMGNIGFATSFSITVGIYLLFSRSSKWGVALLWGSTVVLDAWVMGGYFGLEKLAERLVNTSAEELQNRVDIHDFIWPYVTAYFPFGSGAGSFLTAFLPFSGPQLQDIWNHVHNDYLEFLGEFGLIGSFPLALVILLSVVQAFRIIRVHPSWIAQGAAYTTVMGVIALLLHSAVDFNLQIPANAILFVTILSFPWIIPCLTLPLPEYYRRKIKHHKRKKNHARSTFVSP